MDDCSRDRCCLVRVCRVLDLVRFASTLQEVETVKSINLGGRRFPIVEVQDEHQSEYAFIALGVLVSLVSALGATVSGLLLFGVR